MVLIGQRAPAQHGAGSPRAALPDGKLLACRVAMKALVLQVVVALSGEICILAVPRSVF